MGEDAADALGRIARTNPVVAAALDRLPELGLPSWYIGAGAIAGTVWNHLHGYDATRGIKDYDIVYFDASDPSRAAERAVEARVTELLGAAGAVFDVTNQARVHTWYEQRFGRPLPPYRSTEHAIATWPTTASSVGLRAEPHGLVVCAPFGLTDLFGMVVRANPAVIDEAVFDAKAERWRRIWPRLTILPWPGATAGGEGEGVFIATDPAEPEGAR